MDEQTSAHENTGTINEGDKMSHKDRNVFESNNARSHLELNNCNILCPEVHDESQNCAHGGTNSHKHLNSTSTTHFLLRSVTESFDKSRSPLRETACAENCEQYSATAKEKALSGLATEKHMKSCDSYDQQCDDCCDLHTDERSQNNTAFIVGTAETDFDINKKDNFLSNTLSSLSSQISITTKDNSLDTFTGASASFHTCNGEIYSLSHPQGEIEDRCNSSSLLHLQQQTVENSFSDSAKSVGRSMHPSFDFNEETSLSHTSSDFQPIILDVRGGYFEMETEDGTQSQSSASLGASENKHISESSEDQSTETADVTENMNLFPQSAFQLLQGMAQCAVSSSKRTSEANIGKASNAFSGAENEDLHSAIPLTEIVSEANASYTSRSNNSLVESLHSSTSSGLKTHTTLTSRRPNHPVSGSSLGSLPAISSALPLRVATCPATCESQPTGPSKALSNVLLSLVKGTTKYSCVLVQDKNSSKQGQMAFLIPQSSLPGLGNVSSIASSDLSKTPVTISNTGVKNVHNDQTYSLPSCQEFIPNSSMSIVESITKLVNDTVNTFYVQGKDLKHSNLLKVTAPKKNDYSQYASCSICGEAYYDEQGLQFHLERTVFHLTYSCSFCNKNIMFFNKCSLWTHLKSETENPVINYNDILCLKPYELAADDDFENQLLETVDTDPSSKISADTTCITNVPTDGNLPATTAPIEEVTRAKSVDPCTESELPTPSISNEQSYPKCSECLLMFPKLKAHLCPTIPRKYLCTSCGMFLPSICAQEAHMKIHSGVIKNMSCPECGENDFCTTQESEDLRSFFDHVDSCKHFNRILDLKCFCSQEVTNINQLLKHFVDKHCRTMYECPSCVLAFTQHGHLIGHLEKVHTIKCTSIKASVLCLFCKQIIKSAVELTEHVDQHVENFKNISVFKWKCFICFKSYVDKVDLNKHLELDHPQKSKRCTICYSLFCSRKNLVEHIVQKKCFRLLSKNLNCCIDHEPEVSVQAVDNVDLSKLFETKKVYGKIGQQLRALSLMRLMKKNHLVNIAPKPASSQTAADIQSNQSDQQILPADMQSNQSNQNCLQQILPAEPLTQLNKALPDISIPCSSSTNTVSTQQCKLIITDKSSSTESSKHKNENANVSQCVVCKELIDSKKLSNHLIFHQSQGIIICFVCQRKDFTTMEDALDHSNMCFYKRSEVVENEKILDPGSSSTTEVAARANAEGRQPDVEVNMENQSVFPCLLCGLAFQSLSAREDHVSRSHDGTRIVYHCGICRKRGKTSIFIKKELASRHITKKHRIVNMDSVNRLIRTEEQNVSSGQKLPASETAPEEADSVSPPKRLRVAGEGDYMCGKCGFSCCNSDEFSQHITSHNLAREPQCPECGLCFTIFLALKKHLLAVHKIKAVDDYLKLKDITEPEEEELDILSDIHPFSKPHRESRDTNSKKSNTYTKMSHPDLLECTVCYKVFDNEANLKTHMRNHGMAFIRSKRHKR